ncbi:MAG: LacI family transcriptional regulator [Lachnospiraceae bacterium]|jgi:DNA-binding LacI/PurR family transcriptional regulator|nr:LacI family transcriptional regulator [Lachnospiraceae bacterium]MCI9469968.1 LacI family transcriptional regulator [Lachnospiraceae bacterium]
MISKKRFSSIRDVANLAGVSTATVSRAINAPDTVSEATRKKVLKAIKESNYAPNSMATALFSGMSKTVALFVLDISNPFYISLMRHLNQILLSHGHNLIICETENSFEKEAQYYEYCKSIRTCCIIYTAGMTRKNFALDTHGNIPLILIDHEPFEDVQSLSINPDNDKAIHLLVDYLVNLNHKKIGFVSGPIDFLSSKARYESFCRYMGQHGLPVENDYVVSRSFAESAGAAAVDYFYSLPSPPTAIIAASDQLARGFIMRAHSMGINIPQDCSICGIDGIDSYFYPKITSIRQDIALIAQTVFDFIQDPSQTSLPLTKTLDVSFVLGQTCRKLPE